MRQVISRLEAVDLDIAGNNESGLENTITMMESNLMGHKMGTLDSIGKYLSREKTSLVNLKRDAKEIKEITNKTRRSIWAIRQNIKKALNK